MSIFKDFGVLMKLVTSVLLERSTIFVSSSTAKLSAAVLGINELISPFKWCHAMIPVLPSELLDVLEAPFPILVGLT